MNEWLTAVIGLLGAGVGAGAAVWGAARSARAGREALALQRRHDDARWMREQRQAAYHAMIRADMMQTEAAYTVLGHREDDDWPPEVRARQHEAHYEAVAAESLIELCGPPDVLEAARELRKAGDLMVMEWGSGGPMDRTVDAEQRRARALAAFREAARRTLGYA
ncbi:hypothetical protein [Streptomyces longispororuber]|uniref:hypothetical protein n=1 Tax=Streptomyces longispororuber TaxID=68230 RepID=UPI00167C9792|nr:hypothetical protein [Streptomyces longispororuber]